MLFSAMSRRRVSCPLTTQQLWDAVKIIRYKRQVANLDRITKYMTRFHGVSEDEVGRQINYCVRDGLLKLIKKIGKKGAKLGVEQEGYMLPEGKVEKDSHDWYCFECHSGGDVICCTSCHRVYHLSCISKDDLPEDDVKNKFICNVCKRILRKDATPDIKRSQLNRLLKHTALKLKDRLPVALTDRQVPSSTSYISERFAIQAQVKRPSIDVPSNFKWVLNDKDDWRVDNLIYKPINLPTMESKADCGKYEHLEEFRADIQTIVHNVVIYHGVNSSMADMARLMLRDCTTDMQEIMECWLCYKHSNNKSLRNWFCKPCKPPHELVYAKSKGCPYSPAKVLKKTEDTYEVRYFGGNHERAIVEKSHIRPISVNIHTLQVKGNSGWNKACEELKRYQRELEKNMSSDSSSDSDEASDEGEANNSSVTETANNTAAEKRLDVEKRDKTDINKEPTSKRQSRSEVKVEREEDEEEEEEESSKGPVLRRGRPRKCAVRNFSLFTKSDDSDDDDEDEDEGEEEEEDEDDTAVVDEKKMKSGDRHDDAVAVDKGGASGSGRDSATTSVAVKRKLNNDAGRNSNKNSGTRDCSSIVDEHLPDVQNVAVAGEAKDKKLPMAAALKNKRVINRTSSNNEQQSAPAPPSKKPRVLTRTSGDVSEELFAIEKVDDTSSGSSSVLVPSISTEEYNITSSSSGKSQIISKGNEEEIVSSSSSHNPTRRSVKTQTKSLDKPNKEWIAKMEKQFEEEKQCLIAKLKKEHEMEVARINLAHSAMLSEAKKKQWCVTCEQEAIYHCCWNTSYCSLDCQLQHWATDHKRHCRRKR